MSVLKPVRAAGCSITAGRLGVKTGDLYCLSGHSFEQIVGGNDTEFTRFAEISYA